MALKKRRKKMRSVGTRRRAKVRLFKRKFKSMAFGRRFRRFRFRRPRFRRPRFRRSFRRRSGGFSNRIPLLGMRIPKMFIWLAIIGGGIFFFKDALKPMIEKIKSKIS